MSSTFWMDVSINWDNLPMHSEICHIHVRILILIGNLLVSSKIEHKVIPIGLDQYLPLTTFYLREDHYDLLLMILCNNRCLFIKLSFFFVSSLNRILSPGIYFWIQFLKGKTYRTYQGGKLKSEKVSSPYQSSLLAVASA